MSIPDFKAMSHAMSAAGVVTLELDPIYLFVLVGTVQLALRHPENRGQSADLAREAAIAFQQRLGEIDPAIAQALEPGWHPEFDVTSEEFDAIDAENTWSDRPMTKDYTPRFLTNQEGVEMAPVFADLGGKYTVLEQVECPDCVPGSTCGTCYDRGEVLLVEPIEGGDRHA